MRKHISIQHKRSPKGIRNFFFCLNGKVTFGSNSIDHNDITAVASEISICKFVEEVIDLGGGRFIDGRGDDRVLGCDNWSRDIGDRVAGGTSLFLVPSVLASSIVRPSASSLASKSTSPLPRVVPIVVDWSGSSVLMNNCRNAGRRRVVGLEVDGAVAHEDNLLDI